MTVGEPFEFTIGPFCSYKGNQITVIATLEGSTSLPDNITFDYSTYTFNGNITSEVTYHISVTVSTVHDS